MQIDTNVLRKQLEYKLSNFKRKVILKKFMKIQSEEYFNEGENAEKYFQDIEIFMLTDNSDQYTLDYKGNVLIRHYSCVATNNETITAQDEIILDNVTFKITSMKKIAHPITGQEIGKQFEIDISEIETDEEQDTSLL